MRSEKPKSLMNSYDVFIRKYSVVCLVMYSFRNIGERFETEVSNFAGVMISSMILSRVTS